MNKFDIYLKEAPEYPGEEIFVEYTVTSWGVPATGPSYYSGGDPPEPPEIEIDKIYVGDREIPYYDPNPWFKFKAWVMRNLGKWYLIPENPEWTMLANLAEEQIFDNFPAPDYDDPWS